MIFYFIFFCRELFVYLFNTLWHEAISHKVIFQLRLMMTYWVQNCSRIIMPFKITPIYCIPAFFSILTGETIKPNRDI